MEKEEIDRALAPVRGEAFRRREKTVQDRFWTAIRRIAGNTPFLADLLAAYYCVMDPATPARAKGILLAALAYFILPADTIPDIILWFGFTDDIAVLTAAMAAVAAHVTPAHRKAAEQAIARFAEEPADPAG